MAAEFSQRHIDRSAADLRAPLGRAKTRDFLAGIARSYVADGRLLRIVDIPPSYEPLHCLITAIQIPQMASDPTCASERASEGSPFLSDLLRRSRASLDLYRHHQHHHYHRHVRTWSPHFPAHSLMTSSWQLTPRLMPSFPCSPAPCRLRFVRPCGYVDSTTILSRFARQLRSCDEKRADQTLRCSDTLRRWWWV